MTYGQRNQTVRRCYWLHFTGSAAAEVIRTCGFEGGGIFPLPDEYGVTAAFTALLDEMAHEPTPCNRLRAAAAATMVLTQIGNAIKRGNRRRCLPHSVSYIREHFTEDIDKEMLAAMDGLRPSRYHEVFRRVMGTTPAGYICGLRMAKARGLLLDPDLPIGDIAALCGYDDPLYFSRVFRRECGVSPTEYRRHGLEG
jgi:AraC-like DNA-binding protein